MVLSNKKLKQKVRNALAGSPTELSPENETCPAGFVKPEDHNSALHELVEKAKQRRKLSRRERKKRFLSSRLDSQVDGRAVDEEKETICNKSQSHDGVNGSRNIPKDQKKYKTEKEGDLKAHKPDCVTREEKKKKSRVEIVEKDGISTSKVAEEHGSSSMTCNEVRKKRKRKRKEEADVRHAKDLEVLHSETTQEKQEDNKRPNDMATKVYVGGIPYYSTEDDIHSYFEGCGTITDVDCKTFPDTGKFRGIAIINFKTESAARRALALDGSDMGGFYLKIQSYRTPRVKMEADFSPNFVDGYNRIYIGNLSWDTTEDDLRKLFSDCNTSSIRFGTDKETGEFKGYAHVDFSDEVSFAMALKLDQEIVCGRPVKISCATPRRQQPSTKPLSLSNGDASSLSNGNRSKKKRRRNCYECGAKCHISTDCPLKKSSADKSSKPS